MLPVPAQTDPVTHRLWQLLSLGNDIFLSTVPPRGLQHSVKSRALKESLAFPVRRGGRREEGGGKGGGGKEGEQKGRKGSSEREGEGERRNEGGRREGGKREVEREKEGGKKW